MRLRVVALSTHYLGQDGDLGARQESLLLNASHAYSAGGPEEVVIDAAGQLISIDARVQRK